MTAAVASKEPTATPRVTAAVADLRRMVPVGSGHRGPVLLEAYFEQTGLLHAELPTLSRGTVADFLGREGIRADDLGDPADPLAGFVFAAGRVGWAFVRAADILPRRRFGAAHELGHFVLHRETMGRFRADTDETLQEAAGDMADQMEREANRFAVELLMPAEVCQARGAQLRAQYGCCPRGVLVYRLASELLVSREAMRYACSRWEWGMSDSDAIGRFFRTYAAAAVGDTPAQPALEGLAEEEAAEGEGTVDLNVELPADGWTARIVGEAPAKPGEYPVRFIDGSLTTLPVLCLPSPQGWPIPLLVSEAGAVAVRLTGRSFVREFVTVERVLSFVADPFPWAEVEAFASAVLHDPDLAARLVPANRPMTERNPFDYEVMRMQASHRCEQEMLNAERLALAADPTLPALVDGKLAGRIGSTAAASRPLLVGIVKRVRPALHAEGWRTLLGLRRGQRTPVFRLSGMSQGKEADMPTASWFLKLASGPRLAPNWGYVRVDVPWVQFQEAHQGDFGFVDRLSRWLIDARCRQASYARMPVSLEPIVRAEEVLKPLFTPLPRPVHAFVQTG